MTDNRRKTIDSYDIAILSALSQNPRLSTVELSKVVHLSRTAISRRIASLQEKGAFIDCPNTVSHSALGFDISAVVEIAVSSSNLDTARDQLLQMPEVLSVAVVSGEGSIILDVIAANMLHFRKFMRGIQTYGDTSSRLVFSKKYSQLTLDERVSQIATREKDAEKEGYLY